MKDTFLRTPVLFSGHNERAVVALCRFYSSHGISFSIVAKANDPILLTDWANLVLLQRSSSVLELRLFSDISNLLSIKGEQPIFVPTSEFLIHYVYENREEIRRLGWSICLPKQDLYQLLTNKSTSPGVIEKLVNVSIPRISDPLISRAPCVLKPKTNITNGSLSYPILCETDDDLLNALKFIDDGDWFSQEWIDGQSFYLCCYIDVAGNWDAFWQENLLQQAKGKSIILAKTASNPGIDTHKLMMGLHELGYFGPFMMEIIMKSKIPYFVEVNPRFWGPTELCRRAFPSLLDRYIDDIYFRNSKPSSELNDEQSCYWYAWAHGGTVHGLRQYPSFKKELCLGNLYEHLLVHDIYNGDDTMSICGTH